MITKGDILLIELGTDGTVGSEQMGTRPCAVVSNNIGNKFSPCITVAMITSKENKPGLPTHVELAEGAFGLNKKSIILCEQLRTIDKLRIIHKLGKLSDGAVHQLNFALIQALAL